MSDYIPDRATHYSLDDDLKTFYQSVCVDRDIFWYIWNGLYWVRVTSVSDIFLHTVGSGLNQHLIRSFNTPACELTVHILRNAGLSIPDDVPGHLLVKVPPLKGDYSRANQ